MLRVFMFEDSILTTLNTVPDLTLWDWLFESNSSPLHNKHPSSLSGFTNATTKERVRYDEVKTYATHLSTALVHKLELAAGETVALFSPNSIWYPVAMFATNRIGEFSFLRRSWRLYAKFYLKGVLSLVLRLPIMWRK